MALRAIYEKGKFRLIGIEEASIKEGQEFIITPVDADDHDAQVRAALGDLVIWPDPDAETEEPEMTLEEIWIETEKVDQGQNLGSSYIIEEREQGY